MYTLSTRKKKRPYQRTESLALFLQMSALVASPKYSRAKLLPKLEKYSVSNAYKRYSNSNCSGKKSNATLKVLIKHGPCYAIEKAFSGELRMTSREERRVQEKISVPCYMQADCLAYSYELEHAKVRLPSIKPRYKSLQSSHLWAL
jgi:hypothetical protein